MRCIQGALAFECCPSVSVQNQEIRNTLNLIGINVQDDAAREAFFEFSYQVCLESVFQHKISSKKKEE
jgi:hypothetical protein